MSELTLAILRIGFLLLLWFFIFSIVYALRSDLFGAPVRKLRSGDTAGPGSQSAAAQTPAPQTSSPQHTPLSNGTPQSPAITPSGGALPTAGASGGPATRLIITSGVASGTSIPLDDEFVSIGRSSDSTLVIVDEYTSTYHARLSKQGSEWVLTDLDSTNGTRLAGEKVHKPVRVPPFTPITIGKTTFELRP